MSDFNKRPIDIVDYMTFRRINGAQFTDENSLVDLSTLCKILPDATNNAFYMDALIDHFVILDVEPKCPSDIKNEMLKLPYIYGEYSMSGQGYHLVFPLPKTFYNYPIAIQKCALKEEHGWYEILLNHWITFTRNILPPATDTKSFEQIFEQMAKLQKETHRSDIDVMYLAPDTVPEQELILYTLINLRTYKKTRNDFHGDYSKYEYGHMGYLYYRLKKMLKTNVIMKTKHKYTPNEKAWLLYTIAKEQIPYRTKHDEERDKLPWLLYLAREIIAKDDTHIKEKTENE